MLYYGMITDDDAYNRLDVLYDSWNSSIQTPSSLPSSSIPSQPLTPSSSVIESQIDGEFTGWDGETIFKLTNGQIWQQSSYAYTYHYSYRPEVTIYLSGGLYAIVNKKVIHPPEKN